MIVLVPVSRFRVAYELARGRPYSRLERRVLEAIADGGATLQTLSVTFELHERLLVESVVTLVNAGWVAVAGGADATFVLTAEGNAAVDTGRDPVSVVVSQAKPQIVVLDRVTGQLARDAEARSYHRDDLSGVWQEAACVTSRIFRNALDEAQVQKLLLHNPAEWVRWVGPITLVSKDVHFVPIDVDRETGHERGLPHSWREALRPHVIDAARRRHTRDKECSAQGNRPGADATGAPARTSHAPRRLWRFVSVTDAAAQRPSPQAHVILGPGDVLVGAEAHNRALATAVGSAARNLLVASPTVDPDRLAAFLAESADAVGRRVRIDILPGTTPDGFDQAAVIDAVNRAGYQTAGSDGRALLRTGPRATGSGASVLLYDDNSGRLVAIVGDHDWLGPTVVTTMPVSVRLADSSVVGTLARAAASLWTSGQPDPYAGTSDRWRHLASATEERAAKEAIDSRSSETGATTSIEVIIDDEHVTTCAEHGNTVRVGRFLNEPNSVQGSSRGLSLQLIGPGAELVADARAER